MLNKIPGRQVADQNDGTRRPSFVMPALACNTHCHVFGPPDQFPYAPGRIYTPPDAPKQALYELHKKLGISRAVVVQGTCHGIDNAAMLDAVASSEGNYRGVAMANEDFTDAEAEILHRGGVRGVRFVFLKQFGNLPEPGMIRRIVDRIRPLGWHVVMLLNAADLLEYHDLLKTLTVPFVLDHMGRIRAEHGIDQPAFRALLDIMDFDHAWVKICGAERTSLSGPPFVDAVPFAAALARKAPDRVIWGTDWPHPNIVNHMPDDAGLVDLIPLFVPDQAMQNRILVDNPARLYDFPQKVSSDTPKLREQ